MIMMTNLYAIVFVLFFVAGNSRQHSLGNAVPLVNDKPFPTKNRTKNHRMIVDALQRAIEPLSQQNNRKMQQNLCDSSLGEQLLGQLEQDFEAGFGDLDFFCNCFASESQDFLSVSCSSCEYCNPNDNMNCAIASVSGSGNLFFDDPDDRARETYCYAATSPTEEELCVSVDFTYSTLTADLTEDSCTATFQGSDCRSCDFDNCNVDNGEVNIDCTNIRGGIAASCGDFDVLGTAVSKVDPLTAVCLTSNGNIIGASLLLFGMIGLLSMSWLTL